MSAGLVHVRTKPLAADDPDPTLGVFTPPPLEIFKPSNLASGVRFALVYTGSVIATATVTIYAKDAVTGTWFRVKNSELLVPQRVLSTKCNTGAHDLWLRLTAITGGVPIKVYMEEVD